MIKKLKLLAGALLLSCAVALAGWSGMPDIQNHAAAAEAAPAVIGMCGKAVRWSYNAKTRTLTIAGKGTMYNYSETVRPGYDAYQRLVTKVVIGNGVTSVGNYAFRSFQNLKAVIFPDTMRVIGANAFRNCSSKMISNALPSGIISIGSGAFFATDILSRANFRLPDSLVTIGDHAFDPNFDGAAATKTVRIPGNVKSIGDGAFRGYEKITLDIPDTVTYLGYANNVRLIKGNTSAYIKERAYEIGVPYSGMVSATTPLIYIRNIASTENLSLFSKAVSLGAFSSSGGRLSYASSDKNVAAVTSKGILVVTGIGKTTITIASAKTARFPIAVRKFDVTVSAPPAGEPLSCGRLTYSAGLTNTETKTGTLYVTGLAAGSENVSAVYIPASIHIKGVTYLVTRIESHAFSGRSLLKNLSIASTTLTFIGENAFLGIDSGAILSVPAAKLDAYRKLLLPERGGFGTGFLEDSMQLIGN